MKCVGILEELKQHKLHERKIDLLTIDIEGHEPTVLRCLPWRSLDIRFVLIETGAHDMRNVDNFFSSHGYANVATIGLRGSYHRNFISALDNIYAKLPGGALSIQPSFKQCHSSERSFNQWCGPPARYLTSAENAGWGQCPN